MRILFGVLAVIVLSLIINLIKIGWQKLFFEDKN